MNFDPFEVCFGHVDASVTDFVDRYPELVSSEMLAQSNHSQRNFDFDGLSPAAKNSKVSDLRDTLMSAIYEVSHARRFKDDGDLLNAWSCVVSASRLYGRLQLAEDFEAMLSEPERIEAKCKAKAIELFFLRQPAGGWKNYTQACEVIHSELIAYLEEEKSGEEMPDLDLMWRFKKWKRDPVFLSAFNVNTAEMEQRRVAERN